VDGDNPKAAGDRYWAHDLIRDFQYLRGQIGALAKGLVGNNFVLYNSGFTITGHNSATLREIIGVMQTTVRVPEDDIGWSIPMPYKNDLIYVIARAADKTITFPTSTENKGYIKLKMQYTEKNSSTRQKVFKNETYTYCQTDDVTIYADFTAPASDELVLAEFYDAGSSEFSIDFQLNTYQQLIEGKANDIEVVHKANDEIISGKKTFANTTNSTVPSNGALVVEGGVGIGGNANIGGFVRINNDLHVEGNSNINNDLYVAGNVNVVNDVSIVRNLTVGKNAVFESALGHESTFGHIHQSGYTLILESLYISVKGSLSPKTNPTYSTFFGSSYTFARGWHVCSRSSADPPNLYGHALGGHDGAYNLSGPATGISNGAQNNSNCTFEGLSSTKIEHILTF
jgi:hypothetical protein